MRTNTDNAGRVVISTVPGPKLVQRAGRLIARPRVPASQCPKVNVARLVEEERERWPKS